MISGLRGKPKKLYWLGDITASPIIFALSLDIHLKKTSATLIHKTIIRYDRTTINGLFTARI